MVEKNTLPEANIVFENGWLEDNQSSFLGGEQKAYFQGRSAVSFFGRFSYVSFSRSACLASSWRSPWRLVEGTWGGKPGTWRSYIDYLDVPFINNRWIFLQTPW